MRFFAVLRMTLAGISMTNKNKEIYAVLHIYKVTPEYHSYAVRMNGLNNLLWKSQEFSLLLYKLSYYRIRLSQHASEDKYANRK